MLAQGHDAADQAEKAGRHEEAGMIARISPIAWRHINLRGRFEFQKQAHFDIVEIIRALDAKTDWQQFKETEETPEQAPYFTFSGG